MKRTLSLLALILLASLVVPQARGATANGTVVDKSMPVGQPMAFIIVDLRRGDGTLIRRVSTDFEGKFTALVPDSTQVYARATWEYRLAPEAFYHDKVIRIIDIIDTVNNVEIVMQYVPHPSPTKDSGTGTVTLNIEMEQVQPAGISTLFQRLQASLEYIRTHKGSVAWDPNYDLPVHIRLDEVAHFDPNDESLHLQLVSFDGNGTSFEIVTLFHEANHLIHYYLNGRSLDNTQAGCACHSLATEEDPACAFQEGWASYVAQLTAEELFITSGFYALFRDPKRNWWRGGMWINSSDCDSAAADNTANPTAYDGCPGNCKFEGGEVVEGAVGGALFGWDNRTNYAFEHALQIFDAIHPPSIREFAVQMAINSGGIGSPGASEVFSILAEHGIVYSRAQFKEAPLEPIMIDEPADHAVADGGNVKEIDGALFVRGRAIAQFKAASNESLGVAERIAVEKIGLLFQQATDDLESSPGFVHATPFVNVMLGKLEFDTAATGWQDGDCDLLLVAKNVYGYVDDFGPTWGKTPLWPLADGNAKVNTDEKYLKVLGGWYDKDRDPTTPTVDAAQEGKVIVDNTAPKISSFVLGQ